MQHSLKKITAVCIVLLSFVLLHSCGQRPQVIEHPEHGLKNTEIITIAKIEHADTATVVYVDAKFRPRYWIKVASDTYLKAGDEKLLITGADGIEIDSLHWMPDSGEDSFTLFFPPIAKGITSIDFIEGDCEDCFKIWDIDLTGKGLKYTPDIPKPTLSHVIDKTEPLPPVELNSAKTTVNLHLSGLKEGYKVAAPTLIINDVFLMDQKRLEPVKTEGNTYTYEFIQNGTTTARVAINYEGLPDLILSPGETADMYIDLTARSINNNSKDGAKGMPYLGFKGKYAVLNWELSNVNSSKYYEETTMDDIMAILDIQPQEWIDKQIAEANEASTKIEGDNSLSLAAKTYLKQKTNISLINNLSRIRNNYEWAYREKHKIDYRTPIDYELPEYNDEVIFRLKDTKPNNIDYIYQEGALFAFSSLAFVISSDEKLNELTGTETGLLQDLRKAGEILRKVDDMNALTADEEATLNSFSIPLIKDAFLAARAEAKRKYDEAVAKGGYTIMDTPKASNDKLLETIIAQYKGKPLFIDFWATWCGPCINAMKAIKPFKPEMKEKGVEIVYISGETSPKGKWMGMLPDIGGLHYYLTNEQWGAVCDKYGVDGIPCYMIVDKNGKIVYQQSGFPGVEKLREEFEKVW